MEEEIKLEGSVENVLFRNDKNGYIVLDLNTGEELITVTGELGDIEEGENLSLVGKYIIHQKFGQQFEAVYCDRKLPSTSVNIKKYLASGAIHGIGPSLASKIVEEFGERTLDIMEKEPEKLARIKGISPKKCTEIADEVKKIFNLRILMEYLTEFNIRPQYAMRTYQRWGTDSMTMVKNNPYVLCSYGIDLDFMKVEAIAKKEEIDEFSINRIVAGIVHVLRGNSIQEGHTCMPLDSVLSITRDMISIGEKDFFKGYNEAIRDDIIYEYSAPLKGKETTFVYLDCYYKAETYIASRIAVLEAFCPQNSDDFDVLIDIEEEENNIKYEKFQRYAISSALKKGLMVLTGGPGTGKTTTLNAIISLYKKQGCNVMIAAPTGRAAKRISDLTGYEAMTIHRLLEVQYDKDGMLKFMHDEQNMLKCDVIVIDEMSMVDVLLFESLLRALKLNCRIIMVGDSDQLPSVGAGNLLKALRGCGKLTVIELHEIFRQAQKSCIITNAHKIVKGFNPDLSQKKNDFFFFQRHENDEVVELIKELCKVRLPKAYGYSCDDIQILAPSRKGPLGVIELNKQLQNIINPQHPGKKEAKNFIYTFREGDKIMQTKNNYDIPWNKDEEEGTGIFNGDIGKIKSINRRDQEVVLDFDGRISVYPFDMLEQLELAYAITIHKSQGSEFDAVIIPILGGFEKLYYRNLLYTAVTRAKKLLILIGSQTQIYKMVENKKQTNRYSCLKVMLQNEINKKNDEDVSS